MILQLTPTNRGIVVSPSRLLAAVWRFRMVDNTTALRGFQIPAGHPIRLSAGYTTMSNGASGRNNMPSLEMDRLATEAMQCWADFQEGLSSDKQKYSLQQFRAFWAVTKRYAELTRSDPLIHRSVAGAVNGLVDFLEAERKCVPPTFFETLSAWSASSLAGMTRVSREMNHRACRERDDGASTDDAAAVVAESLFSPFQVYPRQPDHFPIPDYSPRRTERTQQRYITTALHQRG